MFFIHAIEVVLGAMLGYILGVTLFFAIVFAGFYYVVKRLLR